MPSSIEDKVSRFADRRRVTKFSLNQKGFATVPIHPNGDFDLPAPGCRKLALLATIRGLEKLRHVMRRPGYAIEYDYVDPRELTLRRRGQKSARLYLAGSDQRHHAGYEEAAPRA